MSLRRALYLCNTKREKERKREWDRRTNGQRGAGTDRRTDERARKVRQSRLYGHAFESLHLSTRSFHLYLSASAPNFFLNTNLTISWRQVGPDLPRSAQVLLQLQVRLPTLSCPSSLPPITYICLRSTTNTFFRRFDKHVFVETIKSWKKYTRIQDERQKESLLQQVLKKVVVVWAPFSFSGELRPPPSPPLHFCQKTQCRTGKSLNQISVIKDSRQSRRWQAAGSKIALNAENRKTGSSPDAFLHKNIG